MKLKPSTGASTKIPCLVGKLVGKSELPQAVRRLKVAIEERLNKFFIGDLFVNFYPPSL